MSLCSRALHRPEPDAPAVRPLSLRRNFSWTLAGNIVYSGCQWGMLIALAKLGSPVMVGRFALGLAVTAPIVLFFNLHLRAVQATDARREYQFGHYLALRLLTTALAMLIIAVVALLPTYRGETAWVILAVGLAKCVESISDVCFGLFQQRERMDRIAISMMIKGPISLFVLCAAVKLTGSVAWGAAAMAGAWMGLLFLYDLPNGRRIMAEAAGHARSRSRGLVPVWDVRGLWRLAWLALPLGLVMMLISLNTNIPRYFIEHHWGAGELGIFAAIAYLMLAGDQIVSALGQSASPRLAKSYAAGDTVGFTRVLVRLLGIGLAVGGTGVFLVLLAGRQILLLLYRPEYTQRVDVMLIVAISTGASYVASFLGYSMTAARYFHVQLPLRCVTTAVTAAISFWLVPKFGLRGAALAILAGAVVQMVGSGAVTLHAMRTLRRST